MIANGYWLRRLAKRSNLSGIDLQCVLECADRLEAYDYCSKRHKLAHYPTVPEILDYDHDQT